MQHQARSKHAHKLDFYINELAACSEQLEVIVNCIQEITDPHGYTPMTTLKNYGHLLRADASEVPVVCDFSIRQAIYSAFEAGRVSMMRELERSARTSQRAPLAQIHNPANFNQADPPHAAGFSQTTNVVSLVSGVLADVADGAIGPDAALSAILAAVASGMTQRHLESQIRQGQRTRYQKSPAWPSMEASDIISRPQSPTLPSRRDDDGRKARRLPSPTGSGRCQRCHHHSVRSHSHHRKLDDESVRSGTSGWTRRGSSHTSEDERTTLRTESSSLRSARTGSTHSTRHSRKPIRRSSREGNATRNRRVPEPDYRSRQVSPSHRHPDSQMTSYRHTDSQTASYRHTDSQTASYRHTDSQTASYRHSEANKQSRGSSPSTTRQQSIQPRLEVFRESQRSVSHGNTNPSPKAVFDATHREAAQRGWGGSSGQIDRYGMTAPVQLIEQGVQASMVSSDQLRDSSSQTPPHSADHSPRSESPVYLDMTGQKSLNGEGRRYSHLPPRSSDPSDGALSGPGASAATQGGRKTSATSPTLGYPSDSAHGIDTAADADAAAAMQAHSRGSPDDVAPSLMEISAALRQHTQQERTVSAEQIAHREEYQRWATRQRTTTSYSTSALPPRAYRSNANRPRLASTDTLETWVTPMAANSREPVPQVSSLASEQDDRLRAKYERNHRDSQTDSSRSTMASQRAGPRASASGDKRGPGLLGGGEPVGIANSTVDRVRSGDEFSQESVAGSSFFSVMV